jgi:hypothetical protein
MPRVRAGLPSESRRSGLLAEDVCPAGCSTGVSGEKEISDFCSAPLNPYLQEVRIFSPEGVWLRGCTRRDALVNNLRNTF